MERTPSLTCTLALILRLLTQHFTLLCLVLLCICGCRWVADGVAQAPPQRAHIYTLVGGELETSQIRGGSWDKKPRKEEECVFQQRGEVMTCNLDLSLPVSSNARRFREREVRRERQARKGKPKYFLTTSSVLKNEGKQSAGPAACVYISATMNKTAAARSPGSLQMK